MNLPLVTVTDSSRATEELGHALADLIAGDENLPRFVAMYGDLDVSKIDGMPPGRQRVDTFAVDESYRIRLEGFIQKQIEYA